MDISKRTLTATEELILNDSISDIQSWVDGAINGKINKCKLRMLEQWRPIINDDPDVESIPANDDALLEVIVARSDYKTAKEREG